MIVGLISLSPMEVLAGTKIHEDGEERERERKRERERERERERRGVIMNTAHCHHQNDFSSRMSSDMSPFVRLFH